MVVKCANKTQAQQMWVGVKAVFNITKPGDWHTTDFAEAAILTNLTNTGLGSFQGKYLWFVEKNVLCGMVFSFENGYTQTDQQLLEIASL